MTEIQKDKMTKKEQKNQMQYIMSHITKTNPITFKEKFDFFYYNSTNIINKDQRDDTDLFCKVIEENAKLSNEQKAEKFLNSNAYSFKNKKDLSNIQKLVLQYNELDKLKLKNKAKYNPSRRILSDLIKKENQKYSLLSKNSLTNKGNEESDSSLSEKKLESSSKKKEGDFDEKTKKILNEIKNKNKKIKNIMIIKKKEKKLKEKEKFFAVNKMTGNQLFNFFNHPLNQLYKERHKNISFDNTIFDSDYMQYFFSKSTEKNIKENFKLDTRKSLTSNNFYSYDFNNKKNNSNENKSKLIINESNNASKTNIKQILNHNFNNNKTNKMKIEDSLDLSRQNWSENKITEKDSKSGQDSNLILSYNKSYENLNPNDRNNSYKNSFNSSISELIKKNKNKSSTVNLSNEFTKRNIKEVNKIYKSTKINNLSQTPNNKIEIIKEKEFISKLASKNNLSKIDENKILWKNSINNEINKSYCEDLNILQKNNSVNLNLIETKSKNLELKLKQDNKNFDSNDKIYKMSSNNVNNGFIKIDNKKINKSEKQKFELENNLLITRKNSLLNHELSKRYNLIQSINKSNIVDGLTKKQIDLFNTSPKIERLNKLISSNKNMSNEKKMNNTQKKLSIKISKSEKSIDNLMKNNSKPIIKVNPLTQRNDEFSVKKVTRNFFRNKLDLNNTKREFFNPLNQTIEKIKNRNKKSEIIINEIKQIGKIEFLKTKCVGLHYTISQKEFDDYLHSLIVERQKEFEELNKAKIDKKITPKNLEIKPEKIQKEKKKNNIINLQNFDYEEREIIVNKDETPTNSTKSCVKSKIIEIKNNVDLNEKLKAKPKKINKKKNNVLVTKCPLIYYLNSLKNTRKFISLEFKIIKKNKKQLRNHSTKKLQSISIASSFILTDRQKHTLNANTLIKKMHTIYNFNDDNNLINKEINKKRKIMLFKGKLTKSEMLLSKIINDSSDNDISFINLYNYANERYNNHLNNKESGLSNLSGQLINQKYKKINKSKLNVKNFLKDKSLSPIKTFNSPKISTKNLENNSKKSSEFDSEDNQSIEKLQVIKVEPINNNQLKKNYAYENLDFLEPYLCDENSKEINKLIYKGKELDILKVLEKNKLLIVKRINPNFNKTNDVFLTLKRLTKSQKSDIDIILEFIEQKIDELDEKFKNFNAHRLKYDYEKNTFPLFEKEFNKLFKDYPKIVRDFMKERYMLKFGNPFKNPVLMFRMSEALTRNKKINPPTILSNREKTKTDKIMEKNDILNKAKVNEKFRIIGNMKILDVPEIFKKLDETKPTIIREKQLKKTENIRHKKYFHNLSGTNFFKNPILKNYNSLMQSFDVIQDQNIINHNKICKIQTFYKERSMYVDPRVCVLDQRKYEKIK